MLSCVSPDIVYHNLKAGSACWHTALKCYTTCRNRCSDGLMHDIVVETTNISRTNLEVSFQLQSEIMIKSLAREKK